MPLGIQQKQIIVTCNYEARRRGLHKLQLITEAKKICPEVIIILGEDLTRFRNASKDLYNFLRTSVWSGRVERLGFDEVWLDCTDMVEFNLPFLNHNDLSNSFFCLDKDDPTVGFSYDASTTFGPAYPADGSTPSTESSNASNENDLMKTRLVLGSHLARHLRHELEQQKGYTATVGVATNKVLSKLVGNVNKPKNQTTLMPSYVAFNDQESNITKFMDAHDIGKVPGIGCKLAQMIRAKILGRTPAISEGLVYGLTKETVKVKDVRLFPGMGPEMLEDILSRPGSHKGIGGKVWGLINGVDDTEVGKAKRVPTQISIEDSYIRLDTFEEVKKELLMLSGSLIRRMHVDLTEEDDFDVPESGQSPQRWLAHPKTLRLSTRPRPALNPDGRRNRNFSRISRSAPMPNFIFNLNESDDALAEKLVHEVLIPMFRKLHPEKSGWNLSLVNVAVTNMVETAAETKDSEGRDIGRMLKTQDEVLKDWKVIDEDVPPADGLTRNGSDSVVDVWAAELDGSNGAPDQEEWDSDNSEGEAMHTCPLCGTMMPMFAAIAHDRFHSMED